MDTLKHLVIIFALGLTANACSDASSILGAQPGDLTDTASNEAQEQAPPLGTTDAFSSPDDEQGDEGSPEDASKDDEEIGSPPDDSGSTPSDDHGFGAPCESGDDCYSGVCAEHMGDTVCTKTCDEDCPPGWTCEQVTGAGGDAVFICVSSFEHLCRPCLSAADCSSESSESACVDYAGEGSFCGAMCEVDGDCPEGFVCEESTSTRGGSSRQCVDADGVCECSEMAKGLGLTTTCALANGFGVCEGMRTCGPEGLSACDAQVPAEDLCNGVDDDCDGETDALPCDDGNPCTTDTCQGVAGCEYSITPGVSCDDGDLGTSDDLCTDSGSCEGEPITCPEGPCVASAEPNGVSCDVTYKPAGAACDDGELSTKGDQCDAEGQCAGTPYTCEPGACEISSTPDGAGCTLEYWAAGTTCDDEDPATEADQCNGQGLCVGTPYSCETAQCEASSVPNGTGCDVTPKLSGTACDDGDPGTKNDACDGQGACLGVGYGCEPTQCEASSSPDGFGCAVEYWAAGTTCDDGDATTKDDQCNGQGACAGTPYVCTPQSCEVASSANGMGCDVTYAQAGAACDDAMATTKGDQCDGQGGCAGTSYTCTPEACQATSVPDGIGCETTPAAAGTPCDDGDMTTKDDQCDGQGSCQGNVYGCAPSQCVVTSVPDGAGCAETYVPQGGACDDGNPATKGDACNGQGSCLGTPYTCDTAQCELQSTPNGSGCDIVYAPASMACDDGDPTTKIDVCDGQGGCQGSTYACEATQCEAASMPDGVGCTSYPKAPGIACDDGDPSTENDQCDGQGGCAGTPYACVPGPCDAASIPDGSGGCALTPAPEGVACDDGDLGTKFDHCDGFGGCTGEPILCELGPCDAASVPNGFNCDVTYKAFGLPCDDGDPSTQDDVCGWWGFCEGDPYNCEAGPCELSSEPNGDDCSVEYAPIGSSCDDGDPETMSDQCDGQGGCAGQSYTCEPSQCEASSTPDGVGCVATFKATGTPCDDADPTTLEDTCDGQGLCQGIPYLCIPQVCEESSTPNGEGCSVVYTPLGSDCSDGDLNTKDDQCDGQGSCVGTPYTCPLGQCDVSSEPNGSSCEVVYRAEGMPCNDGQTDTKDDGCDGMGTCVGSPYTCEATQCEASSTPDGEGCAVTYHTTGVACDDGDPTTDNDQCDGEGGCAGESACSSGSVDFTYSGAPAEFTVPSCATEVTIEAWGASGGWRSSASYAGLGGYVRGVTTELAGATLQIRVGGEGGYSDVKATAGYNGGGDAWFSQNYTIGGGGASDVRLGGSEFSDRILVAGGGGGSAWTYASTAQGGDAGGPTGQDGGDHYTSAGGSAGTPSSGGGGGCFGGACGDPGSLGYGGDADNANGGTGGAGAGGGGYYGGAGGGHGGGGGGGSSFASALFTSVVNHSGENAGHGKIRISW